MNQLPVELVPGTFPRRFRWKCRTDSLEGMRVQNCEGIVTPSMEQALADLIALCRGQALQIERLQKDLVFLKGKVDAAEKAAPATKGGKK